MADPQRAQLDANLIARKGEAKLAALTSGTSGTVAVTVRLDPERYKRLVTYAASFARRRKNHEMFVAALDAYLEHGAAEGHAP